MSCGLVAGAARKVSRCFHGTLRYNIGSRSRAGDQRDCSSLTNAFEAVYHPTALEEILFGCFRIDHLRLLSCLLAILLGQVADGLARVGPCPGRILDARRGVGENSHLVVSGAAAKTNGRKQYRPPHSYIPHAKGRGLKWDENRPALTSRVL